jgi:hypothetical protein
MHKSTIVPLVILLTGFCASTYAQTTTRVTTLQKAATDQAAKEKELVAKLQRLAKEKNWPLTIKGKSGNIAVLTDVDAQGYPIYTTTYNNIVSAATIGTNKLWPGGSTGLSLNGSSANLKDKLVLWDGGRVRPTHVELTGRVLNKETVDISDHSTHVAGTMMASGVNPLAKGMSFGLQELVVYDFDNNGSEMLAESGNGILLSNHSYGDIAGWYYNDASSRWEFRGQFGTTEDYKFGYYSPNAQLWDSIAFNAPYHLIVKSSGNNRDVNGPAVGQPYWRYNATGSMASAGNRPDGISSNDGYDIISTNGTSKNILTVGAVNPLASGYTRPEGVVISTFSSWGPTDDGRIKPDVVSDGVDVLSSIGSSDNAYASYSGTSMASPAVTGSLLLLQEQYSKAHGGAFMRSATLKGLVIHTADEAGPSAGPDYQYGWGLVNIGRASAVIAANNTTDIIREEVLNNGATFSTTVVASGKGSLTATISWTDPKGIPHAIELNNASIKLIHDLDIRIKKGATTYLPWILTPSIPSAGATKGDNNRDNVEKVEVSEVVPGETYTIEVTHKNTLARGQQAFSLIISGAGGLAVCNTSAPGDANGARIDSVSFGGIQKGNPAGCTTYTNYTSLTGSIEPNSSLPLYISVGQCNGSATDKIVKAYIDLNNDGDFIDAGEQVYVSGVLNGNTFVNPTIAIPAGATPGNYSILRIIVQETSNAADVTPCGTYGRGETQDYRIRFASPSNDVGIAAIESPAAATCASNAQYVTVRLRNFGANLKSNIALSGSVKEGANSVISLTGVYPSSVSGQTDVIYTFQTPFVAVAGKTYTIAVKATVTGDQNTANDEITNNIVINSAQPAPATAQASICNNNSVLLRYLDGGSDAILWYDSPTATNPIASGSSTSSTVIKGDKTYYVARNDLAAKVGPASNTTLGAGGYNTFNGNYIKFSTLVPLTITTAKLYIGNPGKIRFIVANLGTVNADGSFTYFPISTNTIDAYNTDPTPEAPVGNNQVSYDPTDNGAVFSLNLPVPDAGDHIIIVQCLEGATIYRNNAVSQNPTPYPFTIPGVMSITGNSASDPATVKDPNYYQRFYYFFYDVSIRLSGCASSRATVVASTSVTPVVTLNGTTLSSSVASGNQWYKDGNPIGGANGQTYSPTLGGMYGVVVTDALGCSSSSNTVPYGVTGIPDVDPSEIGLKVMPNPNNGRFMLDFTVNKKADLSITIVNAIGQKVFVNRTPGFIGRYAQTVEAGKLSPGVYLLQVQHDNKSYLKKLVVR